MDGVCLVAGTVLGKVWGLNWRDEEGTVKTSLSRGRRNVLREVERKGCESMIIQT